MGKEGSEENFFRVLEEGTSREELNQFCYFCDFSKVINIHHIVQKSHGGLDDEDNLLPLCPNCHSIIHKHIYVIAHATQLDLFYLQSTNDEKEKIFPTERQRKLKRGFPHLSLKNAMEKKKLTVTDQAPPYPWVEKKNKRITIELD